uniref:Uncharacterized protein n=1 Tax=Chromera velia CCMP2878 TaxID=1169474 RepID=A0A0G4GBD1_9ALVE|eukprot:Cvel_4460.t1-p1 / transcript=Cvel_4460.t1 / gene=Cvel_4460 / organism=Chromera_velia_CCMP2878 / gene_product=hypothetical protein / transcript_product=hypothetical protein / location=Cvel_scaffold195:3868-12258(+) / protein_length=845 / sequence_SO=supercontig / SO=protein_coding / is_pseudo=false
MYGKHPQGVRAPFFPGGAPPPPSQKAPPPPPLPGGGAMLGMGHSPSESPGISLDLSARVEGGSVGVSGSPTQQQQNQDTLSSWPRRAYGGKVASFLETRDRCMVVEIPRAEGNDGRWGPAVWCSLRTLREKTPADTPALAFVFHHQAAPPRFLELEAEREGFKLLSWKAWQRMRRLNPSMWPQNMLVVKHLVATDIEDPSFHTSVDASYALVLVNFRECLTHLNYQAPGVALHPYLGLLEFLAAASSGFAALHLSVIGLEDESFSSSLWQTHAGTMQGNYNFDFFFFKDLFDLREKVYIPESEDKADAFGPLCALIEEAALSMFPSRSELFGRSPMLPTFGGDRPSFSTSPPLMFTKWLVVCKSRQEAHEVYQRLARRGPEDAQSSGGRAWWKERVHMIHDVPTGTSVKLDDNWEVLVVHAEVARKSGMAGLMLSLYNRVSLIVHFDVPPSESPLADFVCLHVPAAPLSTSNRTKLEILLAPASRVPVCCNGTLLVDLLGRSSLPRELIEKIFEMDPGLYDVPRPRTIMGAPVLPPQQQQQPGAGVSCSKEALQMELKELDCVPLDPQQQPLLGDAPAPHQQQNGPGKKGKLQQRPSLSNSDADGSAPPTGKGRRLWWFSTPTDSSVLEPPPLADLPAQSKKAKAKDKDKVQTEKEKEKEKERERAEKEREKEREEAAAFRVVPQPSGCPDLRYEGEPMGPDALHGGVGQDRRADKPAAPCLYRMKKRWPKFLHIVRASFRIREDSSESECFEPPSEREPEQTSNSGGEPQGNGEAESKENEEKDRDSTNGAAGAAATLLGVPQTFEDFGWISVQRGLERTGLGLHYNRQLRGSKKDGASGEQFL